MAYPTDAGSPEYAGYSGVFIPTIWTGKLIEKFYDATVLAAIAEQEVTQDIDFMENRIEQLSLTPWDYPDSIIYYSESLLKLDPLNETAIENYIWVLGFEGKYVEQIHFLDEIISFILKSRT